MKDMEPDQECAVIEDNGGNPLAVREKREPMAEMEEPGNHAGMIVVAEAWVKGPNPVVGFIGSERDKEVESDFNDKKDKPENKEQVHRGYLNLTGCPDFPGVPRSRPLTITWAAPASLKAKVMTYLVRKVWISPARRSTVAFVPSPRS